MTAFNLIKSFTKRGNAIIGAGCYAAVLESKAVSDRVIKIGNNTDDPWLRYYNQIVKKNQHNSCVPKVMSLQVDKDHEYYICVMEKLYYDDRQEKEKNLVRDYVRGLLSKDEWLDKAVEYRKAFPHLGGMLTLMDMLKANGVSDLEEPYEDEYEDVYSVNRLDLHTANILSRANGQLVITDPWCNLHECMEDIRDVAEWTEQEQLTVTY